MKKHIFITITIILSVIFLSTVLVYASNTTHSSYDGDNYSAVFFDKEFEINGLAQNEVIEISPIQEGLSRGKFIFTYNIILDDNAQNNLRIGEPFIDQEDNTIKILITNTGTERRNIIFRISVVDFE